MRAGLRFESIRWCNKLIKKYPDIKINLFVPAAYSRLEGAPCHLTANPEWVKRVNELPDNYRINMHGMFHKRIDGKHPDSNNDEFQYLRGGWEKAYTERMISEFEQAGLKYHQTFRPPGWKISLDSVRFLTKKGFIIAGDDGHYRMFKHMVKDLRWVSYNWDLMGSCDIDGDIIAYGHTSDWTNNYMDRTRFCLIDDLLSKEKFKFKFIEELL